MSEKVTSLDSEDVKGVHSNVTDLLEELRKDNVQAVIIGFERKDGSSRCFFNHVEGEAAHAFFLLNLLKKDILDSFETTHRSPADALNK